MNECCKKTIQPIIEFLTREIEIIEKLDEPTNFDIVEAKRILEMYKDKNMRIITSKGTE